MASSSLPEPSIPRAGSSIHSREEDEYTSPPQDNPLDFRPSSSSQPTPDHTATSKPTEAYFSHDEQPDEPPPPYEELTMAISETPDSIGGPQRSLADQTASSQTSLAHSLGGPDSVRSQSLVPALLNVPLRPRGSSESAPQIYLPAGRSFSSAKAREAGFEIQPDIRADLQPESSSDLPNITILPYTDAIRHTRERGKLTAYLIPFPKPRLRGVKPTGVPDRFLIFTPLPPPLSKPAPGEKESNWRKTRRQWQEDTRKGTMTNASLATWSGMKAKSAKLFGKSVDLTRSSNVEFLDRVADDTISPSMVEEVVTPTSAQEPKSDSDVQPVPAYSQTPETTSEPVTSPIVSMPTGASESSMSQVSPISPNVTQPTIATIPRAPTGLVELDAQETSTTPFRRAELDTPISPSAVELPGSSPATPVELPGSSPMLREVPTATPRSQSVDNVSEVRLPPSRAGSKQSLDKDIKQELEELTLIYPPSLSLAPHKIRAEFINSLSRTGEKSRKESYKASALLPVAATLDLTLMLTLGGLSEVSSVWVYNSILGAKVSKRVTRGLELGGADPKGCTCGMHEHEFGTVDSPKSKGKSKEEAPIELRLQQGGPVEALRRYLELACLEAEFQMFPHVQESIGDVNEGTVLEAIGWQPTRRHGKDLEVQIKDNVKMLTPEQDESWQFEEAKADVRKIFRRGAKEWASWCKDFAKDPESALKK